MIAFSNHSKPSSERRIVTGLIVSSLALLLYSPKAFSQDVMHGEQLAKTWCAGCHTIDGAPPPQTRTDAIPSFSAVAQMPSTTRTSLRVFLSTPHARMPDYNLTQREITDVSEYILSLKR